MELSIPGKVFILGEYCALFGLPSLVTALGPRFTFKVQKNQKFDNGLFHEESPAGRLLNWASLQGYSLDAGLDYSDPHLGFGGFGASTAQFIALYALLAEKMSLKKNWKSVWSLYRKILGSGKNPPSGADLVAQCEGGVSLFSFDAQSPLNPFVSQQSLLGLQMHFLVFSATRQHGRKVLTHSHLSSLPAAHELTHFLELLKVPLLQGIKAMQEGDAIALGKAMTKYAEILFENHLEHPAAFEDRMALSSMPDVYGVKGSGALLSDAIIVLMKFESHFQDILIQEATKRGLSLVANGLQNEFGACSFGVPESY